MRRRVQILGLAGLALAVVIGCGGGDGGSPFGSDPLPAFPEPPAREVEAAAITQTLGGLQAALQAADIPAAAARFAPEVRDDMQAWLDGHRDALPDLAAALAGLPLSSLSEEYGWDAEGGRQRSAEVSVALDGATFFVGLVKVDGQWLVRTF